MPLERTLRFARGRAIAFLGRAAPPHELTGWALAFAVRDVDAGRGLVRVEVTAADTTSMTPSDGLAAGQGYVWDLSRTDAGLEQTLAAGQLVLEGDPAS